MVKQLHKLLSLMAVLALMLVALPGQSAQAISTTVVISQVYGGGGNSGATYKNDFIELYNRGATTVSLSGWSVQYAASAGTSWAKTNLTAFSLAPGQYYLVQEAAGAGGTISLPTPDTSGTIAMSATGAKVALVNNQTLLSGSGCPFAASVVDFVGYDGANCSETSPTPALSNTTAALRNGGGSVDTDNNSADFTVGTPTPHNSTGNPFGYGVGTPSTPFPGGSTLLTVVVIPGYLPPSTGLAVACDLTAIGGSPAQALYDDGTHGDVTAGNSIFSFAATVANNTLSGLKTLPCTISDDQARSASATIALSVGVLLPIGTVNGPVLDTDNGATHASPYVGQTVVVKGVIYEKTLQAISNTTDTYKGFYLQNTSATADGDPKTSDGLFVFMNTNSTLSGPSGPYTPTVGDEVIISGSITEFFNMTEMQSPNLAVIQVTRSGVDPDAELAPFVANPPTSLADANRYWERLQGMRGQVPANSIVLNGRNVFNPADAEIWLARSDSTIALRSDPYTRRAFRDAHPLDDNFDASTWDGNGYRMVIGSLGIKGSLGDAQALLEPARTFDTVTNAPVGGVNYSFGKYRIEVTSQPTLTEGVDPAANNPPQAVNRSTGYSIVDYNLENLYDFRDNPFSGCDFTGNSGCPQVAPFLAAVSPPYDYVPASDAAYQARLNDIASQIINELHGPDVLMLQEIENQDICSVTGGALTCGSADNADGKPDVLQELALKIASLGGPAYDAAFDRDSSDLRGIAPSFLYRTDRVELVSPAGDPLLGAAPAIGGYTSVPYDGDVSNPKTLNAVYTGSGACETSWIFPRAPDIGLFRIHVTSLADTNFRDVYVIDNHFKSGPDTCVAHRTEQAKYNAAVVAFLQAANPDAQVIAGGDLNVYPRPDDPFAPIGQPTSSDQLGALYGPSLGLQSLWEVLLQQAPQSAYSYDFVGMAQTLDQMFVNQPLLAHLSQYRIAHINSDFPADFPGDVARGTSDHDPNAANFVFSLPPVVAAPATSPEPSTEGASVTSSATFTDPDGISDGPFTCTVNYGDGSGDLLSTATDSSCTGPSHTYATFGTYTVTMSVTDRFGVTGSNSASHEVDFNWNGFFQPIDNLPILNIAKAGSSIPVKFSLTGNKGLSIFAPNYPQSTKITCDSSESQDQIEETVAAGSSGLAYDPTTDTYTYVWKTDKSWAGTCRQLTVKLVDGTFHYAAFKFTK